MINLNVNKGMETTDINIQVKGELSSVLDEIVVAVVSMVDEIIEGSNQEIEFEDIISDLMKNATEYNAQRSVSNFLKSLKDNN